MFTYKFNTQNKENLIIKKKVRIVGTKEEIFNFFCTLDPEAKLTKDYKSWKKINVKIDNILYEVDPQLYEKLPCLYGFYFYRGFDLSKKCYFTTQLIPGACDGVIYCGLTEEEKEAYEIIDKNNIIFVDYEKETTNPEYCLIKIGTGVDYNLIKNVYEKLKFLFFSWGNRDYEYYSNLNILHNDLRNFILQNYIHIAFKDNPASFNLFLNHLSPPDPKKEIIRQEFSY